MKFFNGPAILTLEGADPRPGHVQLRSDVIGLLADWRGDFRPDDGKPVNGGNGTLATTTWTANVLVIDWQPSGLVTVIGQDEPPFA